MAAQDLALTYNEVYRENQETQKIIRHEAEHDALTGALNRGSFEKILNIYKNGEKPFAMIICDVDIFKHVNDTYGHAVGDEILKKVANLLKTTFRSIDYVCRIGGDEFAVIMVDVNQELSYTIREKITVINNQLYCPTDDLPAISLSAGVAFTDRANPARASSRMLTRRCTVSSRTASTAAASIKCVRILRSCAVCRTCFSRGAVRFAGHCWGRTHCRARFARPACPRKCAYSTFRRVCRRANTIFYAVREAAAAYYYEDIVRTAVLRCKRGGCFWYARELADRVAVLVFGALPAKQPGKMPQYAGVTALPLYSCIVPVPPRQPLPGMPGLPLLLARRLGAVLGVPVETPLYIKRRGRPQKELTREQRLQNARGAFGCRPGTDLTGRRVLLIDDIITTGATASACALALLEAGAVEVTAVAIAAAEELPKSRKKPPEDKTIKRPKRCAREIMGVPLRSFFHRLYELIRGISAPSGNAVPARPKPALPKIG